MSERAHEGLRTHVADPAGRHAVARGEAMRIVVGAAALAALWLGSTGWIRGLTLPDEGRYLGVALEMLDSGDWSVPRLNGLPFFHKPPLFYWLSAASMSAFGRTEWAARVPALLGAVCGALAIFLFVRRWTGDRQARATLVVILTCPGYFLGAQFANHDMLVAGLITATITCAAHAVLSAEAGEPYRSVLCGAYAGCALAVLTKGLVGIAIPLLVLSGWLVATRRTRALGFLAWPPGVALFALVAAPWFVDMQLRFPGFLQYAVVEQQLGRYTQTGFNNAQPWWFFIPVLGLLTLPWSARTGSVLRRLRSPDAGVSSLMALWVVTVLVFFSLPRSKLVGYVLPAIAPCAALLATTFAEGSGLRGSRSGAIARLGAIAALGCVTSVLAIGLFGPVSARPLAGRAIGSDIAERVVMLDRYVDDASFYLRLAAPPAVASHWRAQPTPLRDGWEKELLDGARLARAAHAAARRMGKGAARRRTVRPRDRSAPPHRAR